MSSRLPAKSAARYSLVVVHPLIQHADRPVDVISVSHRGLRQHCKTERRNHLIDAVVDLRIQMVRSTRENDGILVILLRYNR